jgi:16S rRNA (cytidine1402-2'-O)-methyltransferase
VPPKPPNDGALFVVATPIGNLDDLTPRAVDVLSRVPLVLCEDTRHTGGLLRHLGATPRSLSLHAHNEVARIEGVLSHLRGGADAALVSDAGTPCLSDPGARLVDAVQLSGLPVVSLPGPFAGAVALAGAGLCTSAFSFWGFLPKKSAARRTALTDRLKPGPNGALHSHVFYVPGRDVPAVCDDINATAPNARIAVARELTKIHEGYVRGVAAAVKAQLSEEMQRGEAVVIIEVDAETAAVVQVPVPVDELLSEAIAAGEDRKTALRRIAKQTGKGRRELYARWTALTKDAGAAE